MQADILGRLMTRELQGLREQVESYPDESDLWRQPPGVRNTAGNLALHLVGNLQHFIGAQLGGSGYVRDREAEFGSRDVPRDEILRRIDTTGEIVRTTLAGLDDDALSAEYPLDLGGVRMSTGMFLWHLEAHLAYHLGQIDYHRRLTTGSSDAVPALSFKALVD